MSEKEENPVLGTVAVLIVVIAVVKKLIEKAIDWANEFVAWLVSIWPVIYATIVSLAVLFLLYHLGEFAFEKWKAHQKFIAELHSKIAGLEKLANTRKLEINRLEQNVSYYKNRTIRLKNGLARFHRLLVKQVVKPEMKLKEAQQKVKDAMASVLKDFGASTSKGVRS